MCVFKKFKFDGCVHTFKKGFSSLIEHFDSNIGIKIPLEKITHLMWLSPRHVPTVVRTNPLVVSTSTAGILL